MEEKETVFTVEGIHCPKCVEALESYMSGMLGIYQLDVSGDYKEVSIVYNINEIDSQGLRAKIESTPDKEFKVTAIS